MGWRSRAKICHGRGLTRPSILFAKKMDARVKPAHGERRNLAAQDFSRQHSRLFQACRRARRPQPTLTPALRPAGSTVFTTSSRGLTSTP